MTVSGKYSWMTRNSQRSDDGTVISETAIYKVNEEKLESALDYIDYNDYAMKEYLVWTQNQVLACKSVLGINMAVRLSILS